MTLTWDFNQYLNFTKETKQCQKNRRWRNVGDLSDLWPIWSNSEAGFRTHSVKLKISIIVTFYLKTLKTENRTKKNSNNSHTITLIEGAIFTKKCCFLQKKNADISKTEGVLYQKVYFLKLQMCVLTYQISSFYHNSNEF